MGVLNDDVPKLSEADRVSFLKNITETFEKHGVDYWLEFGTLLGCVRDHRLIPWDSDVDIGVFDIQDVRNIKKELEDVGLTVTEKPENFMPTLEISTDDISEDAYYHADIYQFVKNGKMYEYNWIVRTNLLCRTANYLAYIFRHERVTNAPKYRIKLTDDLISVTSILPKFFNRMLHNIFFTVDLYCSHNRKLLFKDFKTKKIDIYGTQMRIPEYPEEHLMLNYGISWRTPKKVTNSGGCEFIWKKENGIELCKLPEVMFY